MKILKNNYTYIYGLLLSAFFQIIALNVFILNTNLTTGGISGLSLSGMYLLSNLHFLPFKITFGMIYLFLNSILFIYAWFTINRKFTIYSFLNVVIVALVSDHLPHLHLTNDLLINSIFGAAFYAVAIVISLNYGQSTGGTDILGIAFAKKGWGSIGVINIIVSLVAFTLILYTKEFKIFAYSLISEIILSVLVDLFYKHSRKESVLIVSKDFALIKSAIIEKLDRGCTLIDALGGYSNKEFKLVLVVISKDQLKYLQHIVFAIDEKAFINSWTTSSVFGEFTDRIGEHKYTLSDFSQITNEFKK